MFFLRLTVFAMIILGGLLYLVTTRIRDEFSNTGDAVSPLFSGASAEYKAFCKFPPTQRAARLLAFRKKISITLLIAVIAFLIAILSVVIVQV